MCFTIHLYMLHFILFLCFVSSALAFDANELTGTVDPDSTVTTTNDMTPYVTGEYLQRQSYTLVTLTTSYGKRIMTIHKREKNCKDPSNPPPTPLRFSFPCHHHLSRPLGNPGYLRRLRQINLATAEHVRSVLAPYTTHRL